MQHYDLSEIEEQQRDIALRKLKKYGSTEPPEEGWDHSYLMPLADVDPAEAEVALDNVLVGVDANNDEVRYCDLPDILCLIFSYLFTNGNLQFY